MIYILYIFLLIIFSTPLCGQTTDAPLPMQLRTFSVNEGLPQQAVTSIAQDKNDFIWLGTYDGLCKYNSIGYKNYYHINKAKNSLSSNRILSILADSKGNLIVGTEGPHCVNLYDKNADNFRTLTEAPWKDCRSLTEDINQKIWVGTSTGLYFLHIDSTHQVTWEHTKINKLKQANIKQIVRSPDNSIWVLTQKRLFQLDTNQNIQKVYDHPCIKGTRTISCNSSSQLFMLHHEGLYMIAGKEVIKTNIQIPFTILQEIKKDFYIAGTENDGIRILQAEQKGIFQISSTERINRLTFFQSNLIRTFFIDRSNCLWIGSGHNGAAILSLNPLPFVKLPMPEEEAHPFVRVISKDASDNLWIGIKLSGLYRLKNGIYTRFPVDSNQNFNAIMEDSSQNLWILTNKNVYIYKRSRLYNLKEIKGIPTDIYDHILAASAIIEDDQGTIWIGGTGKMVRIKGLFSSSVSVNYFNAPYTQDIFCLEKDDMGHIWLGSRSNGIFIITLNIFSDILEYKSINTANSMLKSNYIWDMCLSKNGKQIWVATDSGLNSFDTSSLKECSDTYSNHEKLSNHKILSVTEVADGSIWLNTSQGLLYYNPTNNHYREYYYNDGLYSNCMTEASFLDTDGVLYVGCINGINYFKPEKITNTQSNTQTQIIRFMVYNKTIKPNQEINSSVPLKCNITEADKIEISYLNNNFSFEFIAPNYAFPDKMHYAYKLDGVDEDWVNTSSENRIATYNNVKAGKYIFRVKASETAEVWNTPEKCIEVTVEETPWNTGWAYLLYLAVVTGIIGLILNHYFIKYKLKRDLQIEYIQRENEQILHEMKLQFHTNISHEIRTSLSLVTAPLNDIINDIEEVADSTKLSIVRRNIDYLNNLVSQFLDLHKIDESSISLCVTKTNISLLFQDVYERFKPIADKQGVEFRLICEPSNIIGYLDEDKVFKMLSNLISNAIKFCQSGNSVTVFVTLINDTIEFSVEDTGYGISKDDITHIFERYYQNDRQKSKGTGIGLSLVNQLVKLHKGTISVKSNPDRAQTLFTIKLPVGKECYDENEKMEKGDSPIVINEQSENLQEDKPVLIIVEDNSDMSTYLGVSLAEKFNIICKNNVNEAIKEIVRLIPDLILLDIMLEGDKTGYDLCHIVKNNMITNHIPILMLSAKDTPEEIALGYECGAEDYILKPFSMKILQRKIDNIIKYRKKDLIKYTLNENTEHRKDKKPCDPFYESLITLIQTNISNSDFSIVNICEEFNVSRTQLYRKIKAVTDTPISVLIRNLRMEKAYELFKEGNYTVSEVMYQVGISSNSYFCKTFKEYFKILPSEFVKQTSKK